MHSSASPNRALRNSRVTQAWFQTHCPQLSGIASPQQQDIPKGSLLAAKYIQRLINPSKAPLSEVRDAVWLHGMSGADEVSLRDDTERHIF